MVRWATIDSVASSSASVSSESTWVRAVDHAADDPALFEHLQVLGDRWLGDGEIAGDFADRGGPRGETFDDLAADRVKQGSERTINYLVSYGSAEEKRFCTPVVE
jgi:hypothetical protein